MRYRGSNSLDEAREWVEENREEGVTCPCCGQYAREYTRKIHAGMARDLIIIYRRVGKSAVRTPRIRSLSDSRDWQKLRHWGLVEHVDTAVWAVTELGEDFINGAVSVPRCARFYDGVFLGFDDPHDVINIRTALGDKFDYRELMDT